MPVSRGPEVGQRPDCALGILQRYHDVPAINFAASEMHKQIGALFNPALTAEMKEVQKVVAARRLKTLSQMLEGKDYMMGDCFTVVDAYVFTVLNWTRLHTFRWNPIPTPSVTSSASRSARK
jgi:glutathione S-transferase